MTALALLSASAVLGALALRRARCGLLAAEQAAGGLLAGWMALAWAAYAQAVVQGGLRARTLAVEAVVLALVAAAALGHDLRAAGHPGARLRALLLRERTLLLVLLAAALPLAWLYRTRMLVVRDGAVWSGGSAWGDMALHAALASSFAWADNVPPANLLFPPEPLYYPHLPDFLAAVLMATGTGLNAAFAWTGLALALAAIALFFLLARRIAGGERAAVLASALLWVNGGLGFLYFLEDWRRSALPLGLALANLRDDYCNMPEFGLHWSNIVADVLLPQRAALFGMPAGFLAVLAFALAWRDPQGAAPRRALLAAGLVVGALPRFHPHTFAAVGLLSGMLFLARPSRRWLWFWAPAVLLGFPQLLGVGGHATTSSFVHLQPGWLAGTEPQVLFWIRNVGVVLLLLPAGLLRLTASWRVFVAPFLVLQVLAATVMLSPNPWDNIKVMYVWYALACVVAGGWLADEWGRRPAFAALLLAGGVASGLLALQHERASRHVMFTAYEVEAAEWARASAGPRDVFAAAPTHLQPIASLAGRPLVLGYTGWLWTHGYDYREREAELRAIFAGGPAALETLARHRVRFVYLGPRERVDLQANEAFFAARWPVAFRSGPVAIYDLRAGP